MGQGCALFHDDLSYGVRELDAGLKPNVRLNQHRFAELLRNHQNPRAGQGGVLMLGCYEEQMHRGLRINFAAKSNDGSICE